MLRLAQGTVVVGTWNDHGDVAKDDGRESERPSSLQGALNSSAHLPAVLAAVAARESSAEDFEPGGVEYSRPFVRLPRRDPPGEPSRAGSASTAAKTPAAAPHGPRAKVILDAAHGKSVAKPHFDVVAASEESPPPAETEAPPAAETSVPAQATAADTQPTAADTQPIATEPVPRVFRPAWEVDNFEWPATVNQLFAEQPQRFDTLVSLIVELADAGSKRIALVGCTPQAGCTTLSLCLARRLSEVVEKVALIDGNFSRPRLATELDACLDSGWEDVLDGVQRLEETAVASVENGITLLPVMNAKHISGEVAAARAVQVIRRLAATHDVVLLDAGPTDPRGAVPLMASGHEPAVDAAILVRDVRRSTDREVRTTMAELAVQGIAAQAVAENFQTSESADGFRAAA